MAKVKIQGHASGTGVLTVTAPNTSTDRTITLPDATGTLLTADGDGSSLTGVGVDGISSSADATAITISSSEKVRVGGTATSDKALLSTYQDNTAAGTSIGGTSLAMAMQHYGGANSVVQMGLGYCVNHPPAVIGYQVETNSGHTKGDIFFATRDDTADIAPTERLRIKVDGRGLSQFTAKVWANWSTTGTAALNDSHNVSSLDDRGTGWSRINFSNNLGNSSYAVTALAGNYKRMTSDGAGLGAGNVDFFTMTHSGTTNADEDRNFMIAFGD